MKGERMKSEGGVLDLTSYDFVNDRFMYAVVTSSFSYSAQRYSSVWL